MESERSRLPVSAGDAGMSLRELACTSDGIHKGRRTTVEGS